MATTASTTGNADRRLYAPYLEATWGIKNHWYPALFSHELAEDGVKGVEIAGVPILLRRAKGRTYALLDRCVHRGVKLSLKPTCFTDDTVSCWYHGFTFDVVNGALVSIVASPDDPLIGKVRLRTFPVEEHKGIIFVFVGDEGYEPVPPLADDLPWLPPCDYDYRAAHPLDDETVMLGIRRVGKANWRLAVENGFDPGHVLIHRDNILILASGRSMALGYRPLNDEAIKAFEDDGPKGLMNMYGTGNYEPVVNNDRLNIKSAARREFNFTGVRTSMFLPGVLMVENFPEKTYAQYEWYVPIDDKTHVYWQVIAGWCPTPEDRKNFEFRFKHYFEPVALRDFNDHDLHAREAMQDFYANGGWQEEALCSMDAVIVSWRKMVARHNRGIQEPPTRRGR
ncbi:MAG: Rieske 2Fe-2S domain-containing protein [Alphaproteobacteria bacterium]|nr:Rieske 2Fe-2S domain-containing protein [Alphaproteobacteria bacterium]